MNLSTTWHHYPPQQTNADTVHLLLVSAYKHLAFHSVKNQNCFDFKTGSEWHEIVQVRSGPFELHQTSNAYFRANRNVNSRIQMVPHNNILMFISLDKYHVSLRDGTLPKTRVSCIFTKYIYTVYRTVDSVMWVVKNWVFQIMIWWYPEYARLTR